MTKLLDVNLGNIDSLISETICGYESQSLQFLKDTQSKLKQVACNTGESFVKGRSAFKSKVVLESKGRQYAFNFTGSISDFEKGKRGLSAYDILSCLSVDYSEDFSDFCLEYGYEEFNLYGETNKESLKVYTAVREETRNLKRLFSEDELESLHEIC